MDHDAFIEHAGVEERHWWFRARRQIIGEVLGDFLDDETSASGRPSRVVEIGCGTGGNVAELSRRFDCTGVDISHHAVKIAREKHPDCSFLAYQQPAEIAELLADADAALLLDVLEHIDDDFSFFSELTSLMAPNSLLIATVPADPSLWSRHDEALFHYRRYQAERLQWLWRDLPWRFELMSGLNWRLAPPIRMARRLGKWFGGAGAKSDLSLPPQWVNECLRRVFAGEARQLLSHRLRAGDAAPARVPHQRGISLIVVLRRLEGAAQRRSRPSDCPPDQHQPRSFSLGQPANA